MDYFTKKRATHTSHIAALSIVSFGIFFKNRVVHAIMRSSILNYPLIITIFIGSITAIV